MVILALSSVEAGPNLAPLCHGQFGSAWWGNLSVCLEGLRFELNVMYYCTQKNMGEKVTSL